MTSIRSGLAVASLTALALGVATPVAAAPVTAPAASAETAAEGTTATAVAPPHLSRIETAGPRNVVVLGLAPGASMVRLDVAGGSAGDTGIPVQGGRFSSLVAVEHLGKGATLTAYRQGPDGGRSTPVDIVLELGLAEGEDEAPGKPVVHAVSSYDDEHLVIEGTVAHAPDLFHKTEVWAGRQGMSYAFTAENGTFSVKVPVARAGETVDVQAFYGSHRSEVTPVELVVTETNTASDSSPLEVVSPATGEILPTAAPTFAGSGIPNSRIVVTRDDATGGTAATLCEARVASDGDWSCTSPALPARSYDATITETPTWPSAPEQREKAAFTVASAVDDRWTPSLPVVSSITELADGGLVARVISHHAGLVAMELDDDRVETVRGAHGRFTFAIDADDAGKTVSFTGLAGETRGPVRDVQLAPVAASAPSPLGAPRMHAVVQDSAGDLQLIGTTSYFEDEFDVPQVIVKKDGVFVGASQATWNGAFVVGLDADLVGDEVEVLTVRNGETSVPTPVTLAPTDENDAPVVFPLDVASPAEGAVVPTTTQTVEGVGIPGSTIEISTSATGSAPTAAQDLRTTVVGDGTWRAELDEPLTEGAHTMTITETPYWESLAPMSSTRSFTVSEEGDGDETPAPVTPVAVTNPTDPSIGYARGQAFTFEGAGHAGSTITVENKFGTHLGTTTVTDRDTWSWTRANMGTSTWHLHFIQDAGQPGSTTATVLNFAPAAVTTTPVAVSHPLDPAAGYDRGQVFTFEGTGQAGSTITVQNKFGTHLGTTPVTDQGSWAWTRANMGTSTWHLHFIQDAGQPRSTTATVLGFAPRA